MTFPAASLVPRGGEMDSYICGNPEMGLTLDHFWSITVYFAPIEYANVSWDCSITSEWIRFGVRNWRDLNNHRLTVPPDDGLIESSFYLTEHHPASTTNLSLLYLATNRFRVSLEITVDFQGYTGDDANPEMPITAETEIEYTGLIIVPELFFPKPSTAQLATELANDFVDISAYNEPEQDRFRFIFCPKW